MKHNMEGVPPLPGDKLPSQTSSASPHRRCGWNANSEVKTWRSWRPSSAQSVDASSLEVSKTSLEQPGTVEGAPAHGFKDTLYPPNPFWDLCSLKSPTAAAQGGLMPCRGEPGLPPGAPCLGCALGVHYRELQPAQLWQRNPSLSSSSLWSILEFCSPGILKPTLQIFTSQTLKYLK